MNVVLSFHQWSLQMCRFALWHLWFFTYSFGFRKHGQRIQYLTAVSKTKRSSIPFYFSGEVNSAHQVWLRELPRHLFLVHVQECLSEPHIQMAFSHLDTLGLSEVNWFVFCHDDLVGTVLNGCQHFLQDHCCMRTRHVKEKLRWCDFGTKLRYCRYEFSHAYLCLMEIHIHNAFFPGEKVLALLNNVSWDVDGDSIVLKNIKTVDKH